MTTGRINQVAIGQQTLQNENVRHKAPFARETKLPLPGNDFRILRSKQPKLRTNKTARPESRCRKRKQRKISSKVLSSSDRHCGGGAQRVVPHPGSNARRASQTQAGVPLPGPAISGRSQVSRNTRHDRHKASQDTLPM